jgi:D-alanyl-D-alanine carboxypeptidase
MNPGDRLDKAARKVGQRHIVSYVNNFGGPRQTENCCAPVTRWPMMRATMHQAQPIVSGRSDSRRRRRRALPVAALLTLLAVLAPELTLAPVVGGEDGGVLAPSASASARAAAPLGEAGPTARHATHASPRPSADDQLFRAALEAARAQADAFGATAAVVKGGELVWAGAAGVRRDGTTRLTAADPLVIGSVTKTFVAATVLQLAQERAFALSDSVIRYLPDAPISEQITIRELLDHTSGLADVFNDTTRRALEEHPERSWSAEQVIHAMHAPWYEPGKDWAYSSANYLLLGLLVEEATGSPLADVLQDRFLGPLALGETRLISPTDEGEALSPAWATIFWASGAMVASADDLAIWGDALYGGDLLKPYVQTQMLHVQRHDYGLGAQRMQLDGATGWGHTGLLNTYTTLLLYLPSEDVTVALLVNRSEVDLGTMLAAHPDGGPSLLDLALGRR